MGRGRALGRRAFIVVPVALVAACAPPTGAEKTLARWFDALQGEDFESLARVDLSAPLERPSEAEPAPAEWTRWTRAVRDVIERYEAQRDEGRFDVDPRGYALVRATRVGRGTFWQVERVEGRADAPVLVLGLNFGYGEIPFGSLPRGTTVYLLGDPLGTVHPIVLGRGKRHEITVLEHAWLTARLARARPSVPGDAPLKVDSVGWAEAPPRSTRVAWVF